jgi:hypothetical protein
MLNRHPEQSEGSPVEQSSQGEIPRSARNDERKIDLGTVVLTRHPERSEESPVEHSPYDEIPRILRQPQDRLLGMTGV